MFTVLVYSVQPVSHKNVLSALIFIFIYFLSTNDYHSYLFSFYLFIWLFIYVFIFIHLFAYLNIN